jgi:hypothetical protein
VNATEDNRTIQQRQYPSKERKTANEHHENRLHSASLLLSAYTSAALSISSLIVHTSSLNALAIAGVVPFNV